MFQSYPVVSKRFHYMDSIRGIAALMVVVYHYIRWKWAGTVPCSIASFVFNGSDAVSFFFVLSGFVLSYPYLHSNRKLNFLNYLKKRVMRLYPAFIVNVLLLLCYYHKDAFTIDKFTHSFLTNTEPRIWSELAMVLNVHSLYFPGWTLQIEMIYSFVIIFLVFVTKTKKELLWLIVLASFFIGAPKIRMFMIHFVLGVSLAYYFPVINKMKYKESKLYAYRWPLYVLIFIFFSFRNLQHFFPFIKKTFEFLWPYHINAEHFSAVSSFLILVLVVMHKPAQVFLENKILLYLGKISYSIYLIHWLLVIFIMDYWDIWSKFLGDGYFRFYGMFVLYIATTIFLAGLLYRYVEQPFIKLSKRKLRKVSEKPV